MISTDLQNTLFSYQDLQQLQKDRAEVQKDIKNGRFVFNDRTKHIRFAVFTNNKELKEILFETPQPNLVYLDAGNCSLKQIGFPVGCDKLRTVYLYKNQLQQITFHGDCPALELLDVSRNQLTELQLNGNFTQLKFLYLYDNQLTDLTNIGFLLERDFLDFNLQKNENLRDLPKAVLEGGKDAIRVYYLKIRQEGADYLFESKLLLLGEGEVGKTTFAKYISEIGDLKNTKSTLGIDLFEWRPKYFTKYGERIIYVNIWDLGGQNIYRGTHQMFFVPKTLFVLVDENRKEQTDYAYWLNTVKQLSGSDSRLIVVLNLREGQNADTVPKDDIKSAFPSLNIEFVKQNLHDLSGRQRLQTKILEQFLLLPDFENKVPLSTVSIREALEYELNTKKLKFISRDVYVAICKKYGRKEEEINSLSDYFNRIGVITHFYNDPLLCERVYLDSDWLLKSIYVVLHNEEVEEKGGHIDAKLVHNLFQKHSVVSEESKFIHLLEIYGLMYKVDNNLYVIPERLPDTKPYKGKWKYDAISPKLQIKYQFDKYSPRGLMSRLIVLLHDKITDQSLVWKRGVIIADGDNYAEIVEVFGNKTQYAVQVAGADPKILLGKIMGKFDDILKEFNLKPDILVPCICPECNKIHDKHFYKLSELQNYKKNKLPKIRCEKFVKNEVSVSELLDAIPLTEYDMKKSGNGEESKNVEPSAMYALAVIFLIVMAVLFIAFNVLSIWKSVLISVVGIIFTTLFAVFELKWTGKIENPDFLAVLRMIFAKIPVLGIFLKRKDEK